MARGDFRTGADRKPRHPARALLLRVLGEAGKRGMTVPLLAAARGAARHSTDCLLRLLIADGEVMRHAWSYHHHRYYLPEHHPSTGDNMAECASHITAEDMGLGGGANGGGKGKGNDGPRRLDPAAPAIIPPGLEVTDCPSGKDHRFTFTPPDKRWEGAITQDWRARRLAEQRSTGGR